MKPRWGDTDDRERTPIELDGTTDHTAVILKTSVPIREVEHDKRSAVGAMLIGSVEKVTEIRLNAQGVEVIPAHFIDPGAREIFAGVQRCHREVTSCQSKVLNVALRVGIVKQEFTVSAAPPLLDTTNAQVSGVVTEQTLTQLPLNGRDLSQLIQLQVGVAPVTNAG
jgi:hypothetical protein